MLLTMLCVGRLQADETIDFNREIRPLLAANCFSCHGPDEEARESELRLDVRAAAVLKRDEGIPIVPKNRKESLVYERIVSKDPDLKMPPVDSGHSLSPAQIELIGRWIDQGANYDVHWSFKKITRPMPPKIENSTWPQTPLDNFVLARVSKIGLTPSERADRFALIRRLSLDLTGLPPSSLDVDRFVNDKSPDAYEQLVDRLLQSKKFGEHWARMWLDLARYADTKGYEKDQARKIWRYRDWAIDAFNDDMPYDQFTIDQLAGDLLPDSGNSQLLATAFHRNTLTNDEGGTDNEEFRTLAVKDRVDTTMQVWMGLTAGCAKCHSHKYDPISQQDYYRLYDLFNQTEDSDRPDDAPRAATPTSEQRNNLMKWKQQVIDLEGKRQTIESTPDFVAAMKKWEQANVGDAVWSAWTALSISSAKSQQQATLTVQNDQSILASGKKPARDVYEVTGTSHLKRITAIRLDALTDSSLERQGPGRNGTDPNFVVSELKVEIEIDGKRKQLKLTNARADFSQKGWTVEKAIDGNNATGWAVSPQFSKPHVAVFDFAAPVDLPAGSKIHVSISQQYGMSLTLGRVFLSVSGADPKSLAAKATSVKSLLTIPADKRSPQQTEQILAAFRGIYQPFAKLGEQIAKLNAQIADTNKQIPQTPIMRQLAANRHRQTHIHVRGNFLEKGELVTGGVPAAFGKIPSGNSADRLGVARWLVHPDNPLTARVAVNRIWAQIMGRGIVETEEDFGTQGMLPTHPQLLDWLAIEFRETHKWSVKSLCKTIVMSATYQQSSKVSDEQQEKDPKNIWLARAPRYRLSAETIRDQALAISGLISLKMGGPPVMPPQPPGIWRTTYSKLKWATSAGEDRYRRAIYTFWRRTSPYPSMLTFDAGSREVCLVRRIRTNTPLQALVLMNDPVYIEAAGALGLRILEKAGDDKNRGDAGFFFAVGRQPNADESKTITKFIADARSKFKANPDQVAEIIKSANINIEKAPANDVELATWTLYANVLLNLDETITRN